MLAGTAAGASVARRYLSADWQLCATEPQILTPAELDSAPRDWIAAQTPSTVAGALRAAGVWTLDQPPRRFDAHNWWYRVTFAADCSLLGVQTILGLDGLATIADAWLNRHHILSSDNMYIAHSCDVSRLLQAGNELLLRFRSLDQLLKQKRPRPRWRAPMMEHQQLRWFRTTVLGRTPGWSAPAAPVGPWRAVWLESRAAPVISEARLDCTVVDGQGRATASISVTDGPAAALTLELVLARGGGEHRCPLIETSRGNYSGELRIEAPDLWWPHTHGEPALYQASVRSVAGGSATQLLWGSVGFRTVELDSRDGQFALSVNGTRIFCRGACWTPLDPVVLLASAGAYRQAVSQAREAGLNMLRVSGTMVYESDDFYDQCDAQGLLVWQDFMFANMDYPESDSAFMQSVGTEARQILERLHWRPSLALICGNSEVEQQAAMWGAEREHWSPGLFHTVLAQITRRWCPRVPYWPSSAHGGAFPHCSDHGSSSYYGVGAYLRPLQDARRAGVRFASECLAFANVPEQRTLDLMPGDTPMRVTSAQWKARAPRDLGAGWDFDDVRDHYLALLFDVEPFKLRSADHQRYLELSRVVSGEVMAATFGEWRRRDSVCNGALILCLRDFWAGAGWGIIGCDGVPKAPYYYLKRALQPLALAVSDEGGNGLHIHLVNEHANAVTGTLSVAVYRAGAIELARATRPLTIAGRGSLQISALELLSGFHDLTHSYRFGPLAHDLVATRFATDDGERTVEACYFPLGLNRPVMEESGVQAVAQQTGSGEYCLTVSSPKFLQSVFIDAVGYGCEDQYLHILPDGERRLRLWAVDTARPSPLRASVKALNMARAVPIVVRR